jgi:hypothetical protein
MGMPGSAAQSLHINSVAYIPGAGAPGVSNLRPNIRLATAAIPGCNGIRKMVTVKVSKPQFDLEVNEILEPTGSCGLATTPVTARIINNGSDPMPGGYHLSYSVNGGSFTIPEMITQNLAAGDSIDYTFLAPASLPSGTNGTYHSIRVALAAVNDSYAPNDTLLKGDIFSDYTPSAPIVTSPITVNYGHSAVLTSLSNDTTNWYGDPSLNIHLGAGSIFSTGAVYDTTLYYASAIKTIPLSPFNIGTGTTTSNASTGPSPFGAPSYQGWGIRNQFLIRASELRDAGMMKGEIFSIAFNNLTPAGAGQNGYTIEIGSSQQDELNHYETNLTQVYYHNQYQDITGWNTFNFSTPFNWDGQSNIVIQTCFKNTAWVTTGYSSAYYTPTSYISSRNSYSGSSYQCYDTLVKNIYYRRPNIRFTATGYGSCNSPAAIVQVNVSGIPTLDAGIIAITEPSIQTNLTAGTSQPVKVVLKNFGLDTLHTATIYTQIKGNMLPPFSWSGSLPRNGVDTVLVAAPVMAGGTTHLKAWVASPNNLTDTIPSNDTSSMTLQVCMGGTYTIGAQGRDYSGFSSAVADLLLNRVCSPVEFLVDSGLYQEQVVIPRIPGANAYNTVLFRSTQSDSTSVTIQSGGTATDNYVVKFTNASYISLKHLGIVATGGSNGNGIVFTDSTHHITIANNRIQSSNSTGSGVVAHCVYSNHKLVHHLWIENNHMESGVSSAYFLGEFATRIKAIQLRNNTMQHFTGQGVFGNYLDSLVVTGNRIISGSNSTAYYGLNLNNIINSFHLGGNDIQLQPVGNGFGIYLSNTSGTASLNALVENNFVNIQTGTGDQKGVYLLNNSSYVNIVYNTVRIGAGSVASFAYSATNGSNHLLKNNIFHANAGYTIHITNPSVFSYCNYNNYSTDTLNNTLFAYWTSVKSDLVALKQADITKNVNSVSVDPIFSSTSDLHIHAIGLKAAGNPYAGISYDIDGDLRNATTPDIGADEFFPSALDISSVGFIEPQSGCQLDSTETVKIRVMNLGTNMLQFATTPVTIKVFIAGPVTDTLTHLLNSGTLSTGQQMDVTLTSTANMSTPGLYTINYHLLMPNDGNLNNNTSLPKQVKSVGTIVLPFNEGFESGGNAAFMAINGTNTTTSVTPIAAFTGNYGLHIQGGGTTGYTYPSTVTHAFSQTTHVARVYSCDIDATTMASLMLKMDLKQTFSQPSFPMSSMFRILVTDQNGISYLKDSNGDSVFMAVTANQDPFVTRNFSLFQWLGQHISLSFEAFLYRNYGAGSYSGDNVFIDNIIIWSPSVLDVSVREFANTSQPFGKTGTLQSVSVILDNYSSSNLTQIPVAYKVNNGPVIRDTFNGNLVPLTFTTFTFSIPFTALPGAQTLIAFTELSGDMVQINDTATSLFTGLNQFQVNFDDQFEGSDQWFGIGTNHQWERGVPASTSFTSAHSGVNVWATNLTGNYLSNATEYLYSPYFTIPAIPDTVELEFWHQMVVQTSSGWGYLQYSTNGQVWSNLGYLAAPGAVNWYNINMSGTFVWSLNTSGWLRSSIKMDPSVFNTNQPFQLRFVFKSNTSATTFDGWMIDDFRLFLNKLPVDAGVIAVTTPNGGTVAGSPTVVEVKIRNIGLDTLFTIPVAYRINAQMPVSEVWNGTLVPGDTVDYHFSTLFIAPHFDYTLCSYTQLPLDLMHGNDTTCLLINALPAAFDGGISKILMPTDTANSSQLVSVRIRNYGTNSLTNFQVGYTLNSQPGSIETYSGTITPGDSANYTFVTPYQSPGALHQLCAWTQISGDPVAANDSVCKVVYGTTGIDDQEAGEFILGQNIPNPARQTTLIPVTVMEAGEYILIMTDLIGKVVTTKPLFLQEGREMVELDLTTFNSGLYFYTLKRNGVSLTKKMIVH